MLHITKEREGVYSRPVYDNKEVLTRSNKSHILLTPFRQTRGNRFTLALRMKCLDEYLAHASGFLAPL